MKIPFLIFFLSSFSVLAASVVHHEPTVSELRAVRSHSEYGAPRMYRDAEPDWQPAPDTADFQYVLMSSEWIFEEAQNLRFTIAKNLPENVKLVLLVNRNEVEAVKKRYSPYVDLNRVILAVSKNPNNGFWARDAFPFPVVSQAGDVSLVGAKYYRPFYAGAEISESLRLTLRPQKFTFVGGNLLADEKGNCFSVDSYRLFDVTETDLKMAYGCKSVHFLKHLSGIGDVDEVMKPMGGGLVLTNTPEYVVDLEKLGYRVTLLPSIRQSYRTYANSLIVGKTVFMPTYGQSEDQVAQKVYESLGYRVVGIRSVRLSDDYHGSIHCQVMAYPKMPESVLLEGLGLEKLERGTR